MATMALQNVANAAVRVHFVSNVDAWSLQQTLHKLKPATTAFVVQSKSFTTQETMTLAASARRWLTDAGCPTDLLSRHLIAVTAKPALALAQGFKADQIFEFWDWVGGRYSIWSAIGLPLAIAIGAKAYRDMLQGACDMDAHVQSATPDSNMPLLMALLGIWNRNFLGAESLHIAPYASCLGMLVAYLQQMDMESNGKSTHIDGSAVQVGTSPVLWGGLGIDGQHAYFQLIHQGTHLVATEFIGVKTENSDLPFAAEHHRVVLLNMKAQAQALAMGRNIEETEALLVSQGLSPLEAKQLAPHRSYAGNRPSTTFVARGHHTAQFGSADGHVRAQSVLPSRYLGHPCLRPMGRRAWQNNGQANGTTLLKRSQLVLWGQVLVLGNGLLGFERQNQLRHAFGISVRHLGLWWHVVLTPYTCAASFDLGGQFIQYSAVAFVFFSHL